LYVDLNAHWQLFILKSFAEFAVFGEALTLEQVPALELYKWEYMLTITIAVYAV